MKVSWTEHVSSILMLYVVGDSDSIKTLFSLYKWQ